MPGVRICFLSLLKDPVHERDGNAAFTHGGGHAFEVAAPDVADREHSGQTRFEEVGGPGEWPLCRRQVVWRQIRSGLDEAFRVRATHPSSQRVLGIAPVMTKT